MSNYKFYLLKGFNYNRKTLHGRLFMDMLALRISGYYKYYGNKLMPVDLYDHFSDHLVLCKKINKEYIPVSCLRTISYLKCSQNKVDFLPITRTSSSNSKISSEIEKLLLLTKYNLNYDSGLTISPRITSKVETYGILKNMIGLCLTYHEHNDNIPFLISSIQRTKTDKLFEKVGFVPICDNSNYSLKGLESEGFMMLKYKYDEKNYNSWTGDTSSLWKNKIELETIKDEQLQLSQV